MPRTWTHSPWETGEDHGGNRTVYADAESRIDAARRMDDTERLQACLADQGTQKSVRAAQTVTVAEDAPGYEVMPPERAGTPAPPGAALPHTPEAVTAQYRRAVSGVLEIVRFGAMLMDIDMSLTRETHNGGCFQTGDTLKGWLGANCPDVNYKTALRFKTLAEGVQRSCNIPAKIPLSLAMPGRDGAPSIPDGELPVAPKKLEKLQRGVWDLVDGKSARQLMFTFSSEGDGARKGGANHTGRLTEEQKHEQAVKAAHAVWTRGVDALVDQSKRIRSHMLLTGDAVGQLQVKLGIVADALKEAAAKE